MVFVDALPTNKHTWRKPILKELVSFLTEIGKPMHAQKDIQPTKQQSYNPWILSLTNLNDFTAYRKITHTVYITVEVAELTSCSYYDTTLSPKDLSCKKKKEYHM